MTELKDFENYSGDINLEYGGMFFDLSDWEYGYVSVLEVIDLGGATGFDGAYLVEHKVVYIDDIKQNKAALKSCGWDKIPGRTSDHRKMALAEFVCRYGYYDPDDDWDNYLSSATSVYVYDEYTKDEDYDPYGWDVTGIIPDDVDLLDFLLDEGHLYNF
jgi:hypothetical protein